MLCRFIRHPLFLAVFCVLSLSAKAWSVEKTGHDADSEADAGEDSKDANHKQRTKDGHTIEVVASPLQTDDTAVESADRSEIESSGSSSADQILEMFSGLGVSSGRKGQRSISMRGFAQRQVAVFWDGIPLESPYDGTLDLSLIPAELLESVTVLKGAGSILFGPNGMGGAVNLRTRSLRSLPVLGVSVQAGQFDSVHASVYHAHRYGPVEALVLLGLAQRSAFGLSSRFSPSPNEDGGRRENSSLDMIHTLAKILWHVGEGHEIHADLRLIDGKKGVVPDAFADSARVRYWDFDPTRDLSVSLGHTGHYDAGWRSDEVAYLGTYQNRLLSYDDSTYSTQGLPRAFTSDYHDWVLGLRLSASGMVSEKDWVTWLSRSWLGMEHDAHEQILDSQKSDPVSKTWMSAAQEFQFLMGRRWSLSAALQTDLELIPGLDGREKSLDWAVLPMASARFWALEWLSIKTTTARRARYATLKERFSSDGVFRLANPDLGPESAWHFGLDLIAEPWPFLHASLSVFDAEVQDLIENLPVETQNHTAEQLVNIGHARMAGVEVAVKYKPREKIVLRVSYSWLFSRRLDESPPDDRLEYRPSHKFVLQAHGQMNSWLHFWTGIRVLGPSYFINPDTLSWGRLGVYAVWDARLEFALSNRASAWVMMSNILDSDYQTQYGFPEPGRAVWAGLRFFYMGADKKQVQE